LVKTELNFIKTVVVDLSSFVDVDQLAIGL